MSIQYWFQNFSMHQNHHVTVLKHTSCPSELLIQYMGVGVRIFISDEPPDDAGDAGTGTTS